PRGLAVVLVMVPQGLHVGGQLGEVVRATGEATGVNDNLRLEPVVGDAGPAGWLLVDGARAVAPEEQLGAGQMQAPGEGPQAGPILKGRGERSHRAAPWCWGHSGGPGPSCSART